MALQEVTRTGTLSSPYQNHTYHLKLVCTENSIDVNANKSNITLRQYAYSTSTVYEAYSGSTTGNTYWVKVNGSNVASGAKSMDFRNKKIVELGTWTGDVSHSADGTLSITVSSGFDINGPSSLYDGAVADYSWTLTTIPRASAISSFPNFTIGSGVTVNAPRNSSDFTNQFHIYIGSSAIVSTGKLKQDSYTFTAADLDGIYAKIPNSTSTTAIAYVNSYNGTTLLGQASKTATATVGSDIKPTLSSVTAAETVTAVSDLALGTNNFVQNLSRIKFTINGATKAKSSPIASYTINFNSVNYGQNGTTGSVNRTGSVTATATVKDTRGRTSSAKTVTVTMHAYNSPSITSFSAQRNATTQTRIDVALAGSVSSLNNKNTLTYRVRIKPKTTSTYPAALTAVTLAAGTETVSTTRNYSTYAGTESFDVQLEIQDKFNSSYSTITVPTESVPMSFGKTGVGIGKIWEQGSLDVGGNIYATGDANVNRVTAKFIPEYLPSGTDLNDITSPGMYYNGSNAETSTMSNVPYGNAFSLFVERHAGVKQTFTLYSTSNISGYVRNYYSGTWGAWRQIWNSSGNAPNSDKLDGYHASSFEKSVEMTKNSNGWYLKFDSGLLICHGLVTLTYFNNKYYHASFVSPHAFYDETPRVSVIRGAQDITSQVNALVYTADTTLTSSYIRAWSVGYNTITGFNLASHVIMIGRWK